jgi:hypothetical protein
MSKYGTPFNCSSRQREESLAHILTSLSRSHGESGIEGTRVVQLYLGSLDYTPVMSKCTK